MLKTKHTTRLGVYKIINWA